MTDDQIRQLAGILENRLPKKDLLAYAAALGVDGPDDKEGLAAALAEATLQRVTLEATGFDEHPLLAPATFGPAPDVPLHDIRWRVDSSAKNGRARYISYIDARVAAKVLDEWVGPDGWEDRYEEGTLHGETVLWCHLELRFGDVTSTRSDITTYKAGRGGSAEEKAATGLKGYLSDAFKRAAAKAGVGRNVYALPELWLPVNDRGYPPPNIDELIAAELAKRGIVGEGQVAHAGVDEGTVDDQPEAPAAEQNWTRRAKNRIWENLNKDEKEAAARYAAALSTLGLAEPLTNEMDYHRVVDTAMKAPVAGEWPLEQQEEAVPDPEPAPIDEDVAQKWIRPTEDPEFAYTVASRRVAASRYPGDLAAAQKAYYEILDELGVADPDGQLDRATYAKFAETLDKRLAG